MQKVCLGFVLLGVVFSVHPIVPLANDVLQPGLSGTLTFLSDEEKRDFLGNRYAANWLSSVSFSESMGRVEVSYDAPSNSKVYTKMLGLEGLTHLYKLDRYVRVCKMVITNNVGRTITFSPRVIRERYQRSNRLLFLEPDKLKGMYDWPSYQKYVGMPLLTLFAVLLTAGGGVFGYAVSQKNKLPAVVGALFALVSGATLGGYHGYCLLRTVQAKLKGRSLWRSLQPIVRSAGGRIRQISGDCVVKLQPGEQFEQYVVWQSKKSA